MKMKPLLPLFGLIAAYVPVAAQSADIIKREEARFAALRSGQGREQFYSRDYIAINPGGAIVFGYKPAAKPNPPSG